MLELKSPSPKVDYDDLFAYVFFFILLFCGFEVISYVSAVRVRPSVFGIRDGELKLRMFSYIFNFVKSYRVTAGFSLSL